MEVRPPPGEATLTDTSDKKLLLGLLIGAGVGVTLTVLLASQRGSRLRTSLAQRAGDVAERIRLPGQLPDKWRERRAERAERTLMKRIDRMRSAGH